ncbi:MAG: pilus assembly protein PilP [Oligoflexales bacterium]|nr:pilus assembly protein PilP [Oligoflexales bacterium]
MHTALLTCLLYFVTTSLIAQVNEVKKPTTETSAPQKTANLNSYEGDGYWESYSKARGGDLGREVTRDVNIKNIVSITDEYTYASLGKPDPFIPPLLSSHIAQLEIPIVSVLQKYRLDELRVVGIWTLENNARKALLTSSGDEGVVVAVGDHAGNRGGKIIAIEPDMVKIREFTLAPDGTRQFSDRDLYLGDEFPEEEEIIVIKSRRKPQDGNTNYDGQDFLDTTDQEQNRVDQFFDAATDQIKQEEREADEDLPEKPFIPEKPKNVPIPNGNKIIEDLEKKLPPGVNVPRVN